MVHETGLEPVTFALEGRCSSNWATRAYNSYINCGHSDLRLRRALLFRNSYYSCKIVEIESIKGKGKSKIIYNYTFSFFLFPQLFMFIISLYHISFNIKVLATTYSLTSSGCNTIGTIWLNFCVRNGNRCTPNVVTTKNLTLKNHYYLYIK